MGLLDTLFGSMRKKKNDKSTNEIEAFISGLFLDIPSVGFRGLFSMSPSGEWVIGWNDSTPKKAGGHIGGHRESGNGHFILYNTIEKRVAFKGELNRPNSAKVADNGSFSIEDWHFGSELSGSFYVYSSSGNKLIHKLLSANIASSSISDNGLLAICQTAHTKTGTDGNRLIGFDTNTGQEFFSVNPPTKWAQNYEFDETKCLFGVVLKDVGTFFYNFEGVLLDQEKFNIEVLNSENYYISISEAEKIVDVDNQNVELLNKSLNVCLKAENSREAEKTPNFKARVLKLKGLALDKLNRKEEALIALEAALDIDPKIGIKRKANSIRKAMKEKMSDDST